MNKKLLFKRTYRQLELTTPLKFDCGALCNKKCCKGDMDTGMHLYPGEELLLLGNQDFLNIREESFNNEDIFFAVCEGDCIRSFRPLACRIYPLVPYIDVNGRMNIIEDPRAKYICPLLNTEEIQIDRSYIRKLNKAFQLLIQDTEIKNYIIALSGILDEYSKFTG